MTASSLAQEDATQSRSSPVAHVIELFTSQGCSSCPAAEAALSEVANDPNVLPLAYHVDYWDYIGWRDTYGSPENTVRQKSYGESFGLSTLSTPQMVIDGRRQIVGAKEGRLEEALDELPSIEDGGKASVSARIVGDSVRIRVSMDGEVEDGPMPVLVVVTYDEVAETDITRGENLGQRLVETHPVRDWQILGAWSGEPMKISLPISTLTEGARGPNGCAIFVQAMSENGTPGTIMAATRLPLHRNVPQARR